MTLTTEQYEALHKFAKTYGRRWKSTLNSCWETGYYGSDDDSASLQQIRNNFGPSWLARFRFPKEGGVRYDKATGLSAEGFRVLERMAQEEK